MSNVTKLTVLIVGAILFNEIFWKEALGINLFLFSIFLMVCSIILNKTASYSVQVIITSIGIVISGFAVVYHNSSMSKFIHITSVILFMGFAGQNKFKSIMYAFSSSIVNYALTPKAIFNHIILLGIGNRNFRMAKKYFKLAVVPLLIMVVFYIIFHFANPVFESLSNKCWKYIGTFLNSVFKNISLLRIIFFLFGVSLVGWGIYQSNLSAFLNAQLKQSPIINRVRKKVQKPKLEVNPLEMVQEPKKKILGLKNEYQSALILLILVNVLLCIVNMIDVNWIWFNFKYHRSFNLTQFVHEGTYLLILSILLSMAIMLYFFRGNLNFYPQRKKLIVLSSIWIAQNIILTISVAIRNYHYIHYYGLAYKRIGVIFFLVLTLFGLCTLFLKIRFQKSTYYLLHWNSWSIYAAFILLGLVNWDIIILKNNIQLPYKENLDVEFLLDLSDKTLPLIDQNKDLLNVQNWQSNNNNFHVMYEKRVNDFLVGKKDSWYSWSYLEGKAYAYFQTSNHK